MPASKKSKKNGSAAAAGPVTRSQRGKVADNIDITTYTTLHDSKSDRPIQVVSRRGLKSDPKHYEELEKRFERIESKRKQKEDGLLTIDTVPIAPEVWQQRGLIFFVTHFNVFLYATCFFIQVGTLPVSIFDNNIW